MDNKQSHIKSCKIFFFEANKDCQKGNEWKRIYDPNSPYDKFQLYNISGKLIEEKQYFHQEVYGHGSVNFELTYEETYFKYNGEGLLTKAEVVRGNEPHSVFIYEYNENGCLIKEYIFNPPDKLILVIYHDDFGKFLNMEFYDENGEINNVTNVEKMGRDDIYSVNHLSANTQKHSSWKANRTTEKYNEENLLIEKRFISYGDDKMLEIRRYRYNSEGLLSEEYANSRVKQFHIGKYVNNIMYKERITFKYDEFSNLIEKITFKNHQPSLREFRIVDYW